jgi:hypothetical protein
LQAASGAASDDGSSLPAQAPCGAAAGSSKRSSRTGGLQQAAALPAAADSSMPGNTQSRSRVRCDADRAVQAGHREQDANMITAAPLASQATSTATATAPAGSATVLEPWWGRLSPRQRADLPQWEPYADTGDAEEPLLAEVGC